MYVTPIKQDDVAEVVEMLQSISSFYPDPESLDHIWTNYISQDHVYGYSFFIDDKIVGYGAIVYETKIRGGKMGHIEDIVVSQDQRGKGIGKKIIAFLCAAGKENGCYKISLSCKANNIEFYEKCGFVSDGFTMNIIL